MLLWLFAICALWGTVQAELEVMIEDVECTSVNRDYIKKCEIEMEDDSTYETLLNTEIEIIKNIPKDFRVIGDVFTVELGEYSVDMGLHIEAEFCNIAKNPNSIVHFFLRVVNMYTANCPPNPGIYKQEHYVLDNTKGLPSSFPGGHYLINMTFLNDATTFAHFDVYVRIT